MNLKTREWLEQLAATLPVVFEVVNVRMSFQEAKKKDKKAKPSDVWMKMVRRPVDHLKNLRIIYSKDREAGVENYRKKAFELNADQSKEKPKTVNML